MSESRTILVVANETVTGQALIDAVKRRADGGAVSVHVICPQNQPKHGYVIYDDTIRGAADNRLAMTLAQLREVGIEATGDVEDPDPYSAIMDAVGERDYDEIIISTHPGTRSGWLRQDLITRVEQATRRPVEHVVVDLGRHDADEGIRTLVVANQTVSGQALTDQLKQLAAEAPHRFIVVCPQGGAGEDDAHRRLAHTLKRLTDEGLDAIGQVTHPDPYTAIQQALHFYGVDEIVISTFPATRSGWLRSDLVGRVKASTNKPVHHVVSTENLEQASA
ncbi:MAG TPA: universal stress protein [Thermoleophilaceae bacterium]|nr:universal stress protein [Thermoleophilaceae bacterium]